MCGSRGAREQGTGPPACPSDSRDSSHLLWSSHVCVVLGGLLPFRLEQEGERSRPGGSPLCAPHGDGGTWTQAGSCSTGREGLNGESVSQAPERLREEPPTPTPVPLITGMGCSSSSRLVPTSCLHCALHARPWLVPGAGREAAEGSVCPREPASHQEQASAQR